MQINDYIQKQLRKPPSTPYSRLKFVQLKIHCYFRFVSRFVKQDFFTFLRNLSLFPTSIFKQWDSQQLTVVLPSS